MLTVIVALTVGMVIGIVIVGMLRAGKDYDAEVAEYFYRDLESKFRVQHDSVNRWRQLAVNQQTELRALNLADDLYPNQPDKISRLASLLFELKYEDNGFTRSLTPAGKLRLIEGCKRLLPHHTSDFVDWLSRFDWSKTAETSDDLVVYEENQNHDRLSEVMVRTRSEPEYATA